MDSVGQTPAEQPGTVLNVLEEVESVSIKEVARRYQINTLEGVPGVLGYKVLEIGIDHLVIQEIAGITEIHIPVYLIKAIIRLKVPEN